MSASCEWRRALSDTFGVRAPKGTNTISMSRVIILSVVALSVLALQMAHGESTNSTTNQVHKSIESSNSSNQNNFNVLIKWPQINHTEQASSSELLKLNKTDQNKSLVGLREPPAGSPEAPPARETAATQTSGPVNSTTSSPPAPQPQPQQTRSRASSATLDQERQSSEQHGHWARGDNLASNDLAASSSSVSSLLLDAGASKQTQQQPKRSSGGAHQANRWTHFGARLRPLTSVNSADHYHEAASSSRANMAERSARPQSNSVQSARNQLAPLSGNSVEGPTRSNQEDNEDNEDEDDLDSEAILYKLMQQSNFLMNPNFQDQPQRQSASQTNLSLGSNQQQQQQQQPLRPLAAANSQQQMNNNDEELAKSKRVIKLLKSYSHIHQVDDTDDQIRGAYTRYPKPSQTTVSIRQRRPIGGQQHIFISSVPVTTSQTRATARVYANNNDEEDDGQYRTPRPVANRPAGRDDEGATAAAESGNGPNPNGPEQEEEEFECPNNGIFADVASGCQAYHVCQSASQVQQRFQCPLGTLFNDIILTCDFAHNVLCGKKPGELGGGVSFPAPAVNQQQQQQQPAPEQPQTTRYRTQSSASENNGQQQQQQQQRPVSNGPRHLVIGSPYNLHNAQQRPAQSQPPALSAYPPVRPLSNSIAPNYSNGNNGDDDDENEPDEPLIPATLPPRPSSSPPPNFKSAHSTPESTPTNFSPSAQEPAIRPRQPVYKSNFIKNRQPPPSQPPTLRQQQQPQQQQRPRYQADSEASSTPASNFEASAAPPTFIEPNQQRPKSFSQHDSTTVQTPTGGQANDMQTFSLVINHMAPVVLPKQPIATTTGNNYSQQSNRQQNQREPTRGGVSAGQRSSVQSQRVAAARHQGNQQVSLAANSNARAQWVEPAGPDSSQQQPKQSQQQQPIQRLAPKRNLQSAALPLSQRFKTEPVATSTVANTRQASRYGQLAATTTTTMTSQAQLQRVASASALSTTPASYDETTPAASQSSVSHQHSQQQAQTSFVGNKNHNLDEAAAAAAADLAAQEIAIRQQQAAQQQQQPRFLQDQSGPNEDVLNDGMFLIIRHNSRATPVQVIGTSQAAANVAAPAPTAASDLNAVQKISGVERVVAPSRGVPVKHRTQQVYGLLPPMEPPAPQAHDYQHRQQLVGQQQQQQQQQQQHQQYSATSDQLVSSASSLPVASETESKVKQQQQHSTTSTTPSSSSSSSQTLSPTEVRVKGQKRQTTPNKSAPKLQPRAIRVAKRIKAVAVPAKSLHQTNGTTSVANKAISSKLAENVAPTSL